MARRRSVSRRRRRVALAVLGLAVVAGSLGLFLVYFMTTYPESPGPGRGREVVLDIPWGESPAGIARRAADAGVVDHPRIFAIYLRASGFARQLKAGRHVVADDWSPGRLARALTEPGAAEQVRVTIPEGSTRFDVGDELERRGVVAREPFLTATEDTDLLSRFSIVGSDAEGYLFPETYQMEPGTDAAAVVERLLETFDRRAGPLFTKNADMLSTLGEELQELETSLGGGPLSEAPDAEAAGRHAVVILASMVEAETARADERPHVAAVMLNRLRSEDFPSRKLQIDPTVRYGCVAEPAAAPSCRGWAGGRLTTRHLEDAANRYNTYVIRGLPPGPIGSPSLESIEAVLTPAATDDLFFVADGQGGHRFSKTLEEHNKAVEAYRNNR